MQCAMESPSTCSPQSRRSPSAEANLEAVESEFAECAEFHGGLKTAEPCG